MIENPELDSNAYANLAYDKGDISKQCVVQIIVIMTLITIHFLVNVLIFGIMLYIFYML